jgi:hypothetical protein
MNLKKLFKKTNNLKRNVYAVETGFLIGNFLTIIDFDNINKNYQVLACKIDEDRPKALEISEKDIHEGIKNGILNYVETLNKKIYKGCKKEYNLIKNTK